MSMFSTFPYLLLTAISFLVLEAFTEVLMGSCIRNDTLIGKVICMSHICVKMILLTGFMTMWK